MDLVFRIALIRPCRALIEVRLHVSNLPHPCWNSVESHESIDKSEKRGCSTRLRSNFFFLAEFNTKIKALRVGNGVRSTGGIEGITDQGCSESKSIGALESECQRLVTAWFTEGKEERDTEADSV